MSNLNEEMAAIAGAQAGPRAIPPLPQEVEPTRYLAIGGYFFLAISGGNFVATGFLAYLARTTLVPLTYRDQTVVALLYTNLPATITLLVGCISAAIGWLLLRSAGTARREVIPRQDAALLYQLLLEKNEPALNNYVKLASLSGFVGLCTKLGIGGLPLATIALTILFAIAGAISGEASFIDFAKLTLGAFIGSYVQRQRVDFTSSTPTNSSPPNPSAGPLRPDA